MRNVVAIAQGLGLHCRGDHADGCVSSRLLISETPLSWERANSMRLDERTKSAWHGTVAVFRKNRAGVEMSAEDEMESWGDFFLYGDPLLIQRLMAARLNK